MTSKKQSIILHLLPTRMNQFHYWLLRATLLKEAIKQKNDSLAMYNLSHIYIYENPTKSNIDKAIELLIKSSHNFKPSRALLSISFILKYQKVNIQQFENEI